MKTLYDTSTAKLAPYPRSDDEPVVGLDPCYLVLDLIQQEKPETIPAGYYLSRTEAIDLDALQVTRGWELVAHEPMPVIVSMRSLQLALVRANLYQVVTALINGIPDATQKLETQIYWAKSPTVDRQHTVVLGLVAALGVTEAQVNDVFTAAQELDALN